MQPTLMDAQWFVVNKFVLLFRTPKRGDLVQAVDPKSEHVIIKRVIGLPNEQISIHDGQVWLQTANGNQTLIKEPWLADHVKTTNEQSKEITYLKIASDSYFLMGDNRQNSTDSRVYGPVHRNRIYGLVMKPPF